MPTEADRLDVLQGTLDLLILRTLRKGPAHGHAIATAIERSSNDVLLAEQGSLYPALHRLIKRGWITVEEGASGNTGEPVPRGALFRSKRHRRINPGRLPGRIPGRK
jgi:hypothetical protein